MTNTVVFPADSFVSSIGVNVHSWQGVSDPTSSYNLNWIPLISQLGIRHVRDSFIATDQRAVVLQAATVQLSSQGIDIQYILDAPGLANNLALLSTFMTSNIPTPGGVEPWNEYDIKPGYQSGTPAQWISDVIAFQPQLYQAVKTQWPTVPVLTSAVSNNILTMPVGSLLPNADAANIHLYGPPAVTPEFASIFAPSKLPGYSNQAPGTPVWVTETGLVTGSMQASNWQTSELAAARLIPRMLLYAWAPLNTPSIQSAPAPNTRGGLGCQRTFLYELLDEHDSTNASLGVGDRYGLFHSDLSPKLAATTLGNLISLLADPGASFTPIPLGVTATGPNANRFESLSFQKSDGSYWLAFWMGNDVTTDPIGTLGQGSGADLPDTAYPVALQFDHAFQRSSLYRPLQGVSAVQQSGALSTITVQARLDIQLLQLSGTVKMGSRARGMRSYYDSRSNSLG
jgi:hypothetical protein